MLDSLVRVSRRVRDDADLLAPETRAAAKELRPLSARPHIPAGAKVRERRASEPPKGPENFTHALDPANPAVRRVQRRGNAAATARENSNAEPSRVPYAQASHEPQPEPPTPNFEERLRLPPYSFTYS